MKTTRHTGCSSNLSWFTSSYSGSDGGNCVEVANGPRTVHVRDSKDPQGAVLVVPHAQWAAFLADRARG